MIIMMVTMVVMVVMLQMVGLLRGVAWLENDAYNGIYDVNVDDGDGFKPDQHGDGGDEHDEVAGGKHVGRDREGH